MTLSFQPFPILKTERLLLRDYVEDDYPQVFFLRSDPEVNQFIKRDYPRELKDAIAFVKKVQAGMHQGQNVNWAICYKEDGRMIGSICLWNFSDDQKTGEVGYDLHPDHQQMGIMTEALEAVIHYGFDTLNLNQITAYTEDSNQNSKKLLFKNGFSVLEGKSDPDNSDNVIFSLLKKNYLN